MVNVSFVCREQKKNRLGTAPIEMTVNTEGKRVFVALDLRCKPEDFKTAMAGEGNTYILEYVTACRKKVDTIIVEYTKQGIEITADSLKRGFKTVAKTYTIGDLFREFIGIQRRKIGKDISNDTFKRYERTTTMFLEETKLAESDPASSVNYSHFVIFQTALDSKLGKGTARNYLQKIKSIFKYAFETGKIPANPGYGLKVKNVENDVIQYLTSEELERISSRTFIRRLQEVADAFLFSCYTGLSFSDISQLEPEDYQVGKSFVYINKKRKKTGVMFCAVLFEQALAIAQKYNYKIPIKSTQKTNAYLKEIGDICGIEKSLHFHMARHTAACYYINHRPALPSETIQRIFGWTNPRQLRHYAKLFNTTVFEDVEKAFGSIGTPDRESVINAPKQAKSSQIEELPDDDLEAFRKLLGLDEEEPA